MVAQTQLASSKTIVPLVFQAANVADADGTAKTLNIDSNDYVMPWAGSIVGISVRHNADLTGGVITWTPTVDGTAKTALSAVTDDTNQQAYKAIEGRRISFAKGARIGVAWTKTGTVAPTTTDVAITLWVLLEDVRL